MPTCASTTLFHNLPLSLRPIVHCVGLAASGIVDMISPFSQSCVSHAQMVIWELRMQRAWVRISASITDIDSLYINVLNEGSSLSKWKL